MVLTSLDWLVLTIAPYAMRFSVLKNQLIVYGNAIYMGHENSL